MKKTRKCVMFCEIIILYTKHMVKQKMSLTKSSFKAALKFLLSQCHIFCCKYNCIALSGGYGECIYSLAYEAITCVKVSQLRLFSGINTLGLLHDPLSNHTWLSFSEMSNVCCNLYFKLCLPVCHLFYDLFHVCSHYNFWIHRMYVQVYYVCNTLA
jgi:hypothetical protein